MDGSSVDMGSAAEGLSRLPATLEGSSGTMLLADSLKVRTRSLHRQAEQSGVIAGILRGTVGRESYVLLLRNLHPVYTALERALETAKAKGQLSSVAQPAVYRTASLAQDLSNLWGAAWRSSLPVLPAAERYVRRVEEAALGDAARLYGHAYTRYLGDLNGGQVLRRLLARSLNFAPSCLTFYDFPEVADLKGFRISYRDAINRAALPPARFHAAVEEGALAFVHNIELSKAIDALGAAHRSPGAD